MVLEEDGVITAWVRAMPGNPGRVYVLAERGPYDALLGAGLDVIQDEEVFCLAPDYCAELASALERAGFEPVAEYQAMAKRLTKPIEQPAVEKSSEVVPVA